MSPATIPGNLLLKNGMVITGEQKNNWTPADIDTALWLDAADASTITESGGVVSQWDDKSGNGRHVTQATAANQPTFAANAVNGKSAIDFDGNDLLDNTNAALQRNLSGSTIFSVSKLDVNSAGGKCIFQTVTSGGSTRSIFDYNGGTVTGFSAAGRRTVTNSFQRQGISAYSGAVALNSAVFDYAAATLSLIENGTITVNAAAFQDAGATDNDAGGISVGALSNNTANWDGYICELLFVDSAVSTDTRQLIEGYLAHKWGLTANLPADHPYKTAIPVP